MVEPASALGRLLWWWTPAVAVMAGIFAVSGIENLSAPPGGVSDKAGHAMAYGGLALFVLRAVARARVTHVTWGGALLAWGLTVAYGATDELHQYFVPGRFAAFDDWVADAVGSAVALVVVTASIAGSRETPGV